MQPSSDVGCTPNRSKPIGIALEILFHLLPKCAVSLVAEPGVACAMTIS
jgi:hypothetical protein